MSRLGQSVQQLAYLRTDLLRLVDRNPARWLMALFGEPFLVVVCYRTSRAARLLAGPFWKPLWLVTRPLAWLLRPWFGIADIHPEAEIGPGLLVLHPRLSVVVSGYAVIGRNLTLTGGNVIGARRKIAVGDLWIGDNVTLGAHAVVLGPAVVGGGAKIGAGAVAIHDIPAGATAVGVPARAIPSAVAR
jgi:serine O-acetyltransferase